MTRRCSAALTDRVLWSLVLVLVLASVWAAVALMAPPGWCGDSLTPGEHPRGASELLLTPWRLRAIWAQSPTVSGTGFSATHTKRHVCSDKKKSATDWVAAPDSFDPKEEGHQQRT